MKIVVAPERVSSNFNAVDIANFLYVNLKSLLSGAVLLKCPLTDSGEELIDALLASEPGERCFSVVGNAWGEAVEVGWAWFPSKGVAVIEAAEICDSYSWGGKYLNSVSLSSSGGIGDLIIEALDIGANRIVLILNDSVIGDAGKGMLERLGARFLDSEGWPLPPGGIFLSALDRIDLADLEPRITQVRFEVVGECSKVDTSIGFRCKSQITKTEQARLHRALAHFAKYCDAHIRREECLRQDFTINNGVGLAAQIFLHAEYRRCLELLAELIDLVSKTKEADVVIAVREQSAHSGTFGSNDLVVKQLTQNYNIPVLTVSGRHSASNSDYCFDLQFVSTLELLDESSELRVVAEALNVLL